MIGQVSFLEESVADNFAGGGGASIGIELALGRPVDFAINHDPAAILMHKTNHPYTKHLQASVWDIDPEELCQGRPVGLAWFSPDCTHFSKARGGKPVDKNIRGLAWVTLRWAEKVRPRVIMLENVEEFQTWGPLMEVKTAFGRTEWIPDPNKIGETFRAFVGILTTGVPEDHPALDEACFHLELKRNSPEVQHMIEGYGYTLEYRELVAADYGAPTARKRFVLIARCDGQPIRWPERTHAPRDSEEVRSGKYKPWRSAAEIICWDIPMYSIFATKQEIKERYGVRAVRPLADNTVRRIIRGVDKFTLKNRRPFLVGCNHSGDGHIADIGKPIGTVTQKCTMGVCEPVMAPVTFSNTGCSAGTPADEPIHTVRTAGGQILASANLMSIGQTGGGDRVRDVREPAPTTVSKQETCLVAANLIQYHTEQSESARVNTLDAPIPTVDASNRYGLTACHLIEFYGNGQPIDITEPMHTVTSHDREALAAAHVVKFKGENLAHTSEELLCTVTADGGEFEVKAVKTAKYSQGADLGYWPEVRDLLNKYCGYNLANDEVLLLNIAGVWLYIHDITMRMLIPRELYRGMGFPDDYIIDHDYRGNPYPKSEQTRKCGNAVCPPMATALVKANFPEYRYNIRTMRELESRIAI